MTDLTPAVEAATAELTHRLDAGDLNGYRLRNHQDYPDAADLAGGLVAAAAPILRAQVLAEAREAVDDVDPGECIDQFQAVGRALAAIDALYPEATR